MKPLPVPGALEGVQALRNMGYRLAIVTARHTEEKERTEAWLDHYFPGIFETLVCTGQFLKDEEGNELHVKIGKAEVCHRLNAKVLIDDSVENALSCSQADPPINVLLFGAYQWNQRESRLEHPQDHLGYKERLEFEGGKRWWEEECVALPGNVVRIPDWGKVVDWIRKHRAEGLI